MTLMEKQRKHDASMSYGMIVARMEIITHLINEAKQCSYGMGLGHKFRERLESMRTLSDICCCEAVEKFVREKKDVPVEVQRDEPTDCGGIGE